MKKHPFRTGEKVLMMEQPQVPAGDGITRREFVILTSSAAMGVLTSAGWPASAQSPRPSRVEVFTNVADPNFFRLTYPNGRTVTLSGIKDSTGLPVAIKSMIADAEDLDPKKRFYLSLDDRGRPSSAFFEAGESILFEYISTTAVVITFTTADGRYSYKDTLVIQPPANAPSDSSSQILDASVVEQDENNEFMAQSSAIAGSPITGTLHVTCQGRPVDAETVRGFVGGEGIQSIYVQLNRVAEGMYQFTIPTSSITRDDIINLIKAYQDLCKKLTDDRITGPYSIGAALFLGGGLCSKIAKEPRLVALCTAAAASLTTVCAYFPDGPPPNASVSFVNLFSPQYEFNFFASLGGAAESTRIRIGITDRVVEASINFSPDKFPDVSRLEDMKTEPTIPQADRDYTILFKLLCTPTNRPTPIVVDVSGTDGYRLQKTIQSRGESMLVVPGGWRDTVETITAAVIGSEQTLEFTFRGGGDPPVNRTVHFDATFSNASGTNANTATLSTNTVSSPASGEGVVARGTNRQLLTSVPLSTGTYDAANRVRYGEGEGSDRKEWVATGGTIQIRSFRIGKVEVIVKDATMQAASYTPLARGSFTVKVDAYVDKP